MLTGTSYHSHCTQKGTVYQIKYIKNYDNLKENQLNIIICKPDKGMFQSYIPVIGQNLTDAQRTF